MGVLVIISVHVFTVFFIVFTVFSYCFVYVYLFLLVLSYQCKDCCHRVTTQLQQIIVIIIIIIIIIIIPPTDLSNSRPTAWFRQSTANSPSGSGVFSATSIQHLSVFSLRTSAETTTETQWRNGGGWWWCEGKSTTLRMSQVRKKKEDYFEPVLNIHTHLSCSPLSS